MHSDPDLAINFDRSLKNSGPVIFMGYVRTFQADHYLDVLVN
jgi:hypothetical protein